MRKKSAFTLVELLVVISIIALLLSILMPALGKARELGRRTVCLSLLKSFGQSNMLYAASNNGYFVPFSQPHADASLSWGERWCENEEFREYISVNTRVKIEDGGWNDAFMYPKELRCPSQKIGNIDDYTFEIESLEGWKVVISYGYNVEHWRRGGNLMSDYTWWPGPTEPLYGHRQGKIKQPGEKMMFIDNNYYQARYERANYINYWDTYGETISMLNLGQVSYRHSDGAALVFFDGHADRLVKDLIWDKDNSPPPFRVTYRRPHKLWDVGSTADLRY